MSDTPRTDAARDYTAPEKLDQLCQQLERELNEARFQAAEFKETGQRFERESRNFFEQSCKNLNRAEIAERSYNEARIERDGAVLAAQNWEDAAAQHLSNEQFWYGLVTQIGELFGIDAKTADDGTVYDSVVALKVPELVGRLRADHDRMKRELVEAGWTYTDGAKRWKPPVNHKMGELWQRLFETESERDALIEALQQVRTLSSKSYFTFPGYALAMEDIKKIVGSVEDQKNG